MGGGARGGGRRLSGPHPEDDMEGIENPEVRKLSELLPFARPYRWHILGALLLAVLVAATG